MTDLECNARVRSFRRKEVIYFPSTPGESVLIVLKGRVKLKDITPDGKESILAFVEVGEVFGELALFDDDNRQNYAEAVLETQIAAVPKEPMLEVMNRRADLSLRITKLVGLRRKQAEARLRQLLFRTTRERLVYVLLNLLSQHSEKNGTTTEITLPLSHQDIAGLIGATRESVTMALGELQGEGLIRVKRQRLILYDIDRLRGCVTP
ncbi:MAG TPA: Crp/Fnr family transcriptional regulator [Gemmatales bacterium]|nr:Crp/Fnr family transcriptional regulator [Gemmatales bacterium]